MPQAEVGRRLGISGASVVQLVDELEERGLVERRRLEWDRRTQVLHLLPRRPRCWQQARSTSRGDAGRRGWATSTCARLKRLVLLLQRFVTGE